MTAGMESSFYTFCRFWVKAYFKLVHRSKCFGVEHFPQTGPFILAANHCSFYDPPLLAYPLSRPLHFFARRSLLRHKLLGRLILALNTIPVDRNAADIGALKKVFAVLKRGEGVLMFPEGTRAPDGRPGPPQSGIGMVACRGGAPVVPARTFGAYEAWGKQNRFPRPLRPISVVYGPPLAPGQFDPGSAAPDRYAEAARRIMDAILELRPPPGSPL